ncbi:unnamed protein product [Bodo saltans]|uniref:Uncharacterized protein n=1 Tax=Bodo saltans TaxID=75058 RepID=A0A0S4JH18_BODSA|nr:unnamed protein product [Bodo saltans]|eukprot:CUG89228.1 unnamed protein product [Bodo saltans]
MPRRRQEPLVEPSEMTKDQMITELSKNKVPFLKTSNKPVLLAQINELRSSAIAQRTLRNSIPTAHTPGHPQHPIIVGTPTLGSLTNEQQRRQPSEDQDDARCMESPTTRLFPSARHALRYDANDNTEDRLQSEHHTPREIEKMYDRGIIDDNQRILMRADAITKLPETLYVKPTEVTQNQPKQHEQHDDTTKLLNNIDLMHAEGKITSQKRNELTLIVLQRGAETNGPAPNRPTPMVPQNTIVSTESGERKRNFIAYRHLHIGTYEQPWPSATLIAFARDFPTTPAFNANVEYNTHFRQLSKHFGHFFVFINSTDLTPPQNPTFLHEYRMFLGHLVTLQYMAADMHTKDKKLGGIARTFTCDLLQLDTDLASIQKQDGDDLLSIVTRQILQKSNRDTREYRDHRDNRDHRGNRDHRDNRDTRDYPPTHWNV